MGNLRGKRVLFLAPLFFGYENEISKEIENQGAEVIFFDERPKNDFVTKVLIRLQLKTLIKKRIDTYFEGIVQSTKSVHLDYLFIANPESIGTEHISLIRRFHPAIIVITYMWDSIRNKQGSLKYLECSDLFFTFDPADGIHNPKIKFLPLFYIADYKQIGQTVTTEYEYDISFIGTVHSDRYSIVQQIKNSINDETLKMFLYFYSPSKLLFALKKLTDKNFRHIKLADVSFKALSKEQVLKVIQRSKCVIDIEHPSQNGLTMRTIEMLGAKRNLITTNNKIITYDFFDNRNIVLIDRNNVYIKGLPLKWNAVDESIYEKYSLSSWVDHIFNQ